MKLKQLFKFLNQFRSQPLAVFALLLIVLAVIFSDRFRPFVRHQEPDFLSFRELKILSKKPNPNWFLKSKLEKFWRTPLISNDAYYQGVRPEPKKDPKLGSYLRIASWNIEKSIRIKEAVTLFSSKDGFLQMLDPSEAPPGSGEMETVTRQRDRLASADILVLQEMDIGVKRSGYVHAAAELAQALKMNYAYGAEQLEIDPVYLGTEQIYFSDGMVDQAATDYYRVDPSRYKGVFGCAVLSRYPIKDVKVFQLQHQAYDWYRGEKPKIGFFEKARRVGAEILFENELTREIKTGGRIYFRTDLAIPGLPENTLTIINIHLEIKSLPKGREEQLAEILSYVRKIKHSVILMGDFNSAPQDLSPTSGWRIAERTVKNPETWVTVGTSALLPHALVINTARFLGKVTKNLNDPLAPNISIIAPNPVKPLFDMVEEFRFNDGGMFDFRGDIGRSINGKDGTLANSNERGTKGFETTFRVRRPISVIGKYRLDWAFVKSFLKDSNASNGPYRLAPHFGETLEEMNTSLKIPISDHHPNVVDLPFEEPKILS